MSTLNYNVQDTDSLYSLRRSGADLSMYHDQLARERSARTLNLRRSSRPSIASILGRSRQHNSPLRVKLFDTTNFPFLDPGYFANVFSEGNKAAILEIIKNITTVYSATPRLLLNTIQAEEISEPLNNILTETEDEALIVEILQMIGLIYPRCGTNQEKFIDDGLVFSFLNFLQSESIPLLQATLTCIDAISDASSYARDSILCTGLHPDIIRIAKAEKSPELTEIACDALDRIFSNPEQIDSKMISTCIEPIAELLSLSDVVAVKSVIQAIVAITNKRPSLVFKLFEMGLTDLIISFLSNEELIGATLPLIGNMSVTQVTNITKLLDGGLLGVLHGLIGGEYTSEVFWVLSNLVESVPQILIDTFDEGFIESTIEACIEADYDIKKEATFFLATVIIFTPLSNMGIFLRIEVSDVIESMIGCGVGLIVLRCLDALVKLVYCISHMDAPADFVSSLTSEDMHSVLENVIRSGSPLMQERAAFIVDIIDSDNSSHLAE